MEAGEILLKRGLLDAKQLVLEQHLLQGIWGATRGSGWQQRQVKVRGNM